MRNFVLICIDCLRYDFLKRSLQSSRFLSNLSESDTLFFESAYTTAPWTYPATNSMLTGLYPHNHGACHRGIYRNSVKEPWPSTLNSKVPTIFSELKGYGFYTLGISTIFWALNENCEYHGCDRIIREWVIKSFAETYEKEIKKNPFFAYLHLCDLHRPFDLDLAVKHSSEPIQLMEGIDEWDIRPHLDDSNKASQFKANKVRLYFALIDYVFAQIGELIEFLLQKNIFDDTTIIITADHGEEFWDHEEFQRQHYDCGYRSKTADHGEEFWDHEEFQRQHYDCGYRSKQEWLIGTGHGQTLFNEIVHVPLILINPKFHLDSEAVSLPVSLVDIYPTVLEILGIEVRSNLDGRSLLKPIADRKILVENTLYGFERKAMIHGSVKHIYSPYEDHFAVCDLLSDPFEKHPKMERADSHIRAMLDCLFAHQDQYFQGELQ